MIKKFVITKHTFSNCPKTAKNGKKYWACDHCSLVLAGEYFYELEHIDGPATCPNP